MKVLSSLGIGLSLVFGCLFLALLAEVYYLFWWKKRVVNRDIEGANYNNSSSSSIRIRDLFCFLCLKRPSFLSSTALNPQEICSTVDESSKDHVLLKPFDGDEGIEAELMRLHHLTGPPRFLFTIIEETKEDLESEDVKSKGGRSRRTSRGRSLSDAGVPVVETPFLTPLASPTFFTPSHTPFDCWYNQHALNPLFESSRQDEFVRVRSSPPPKFKFLRDAEDKLYKKTLMEEAFRAGKTLSNGANYASTTADGATTLSPSINLEEENGSFITFLIGKNRDKGQHPELHSSTSSQVLPLTSSPSKLKLSHDKLINHLNSRD